MRSFLYMRIAIYKDLRETGILDPLLVKENLEYEVLKNLYARLVRRSNDGRIVADLPESFYWKENQLIFVFHDQFKSSIGSVVGVEDAYMSLKRSMILNPYRAGGLQQFLCPDYSLHSIHDTCPGLEIKGNQLVLTLVNINARDLLLEYLESVEFSIVPREAINFNKSQLSLINNINTTGVYFVNTDSAMGFRILANKDHKFFSKGMPEVIDFVPVLNISSLSEMVDQNIDVVSNTSSFSLNAVDDSKLDFFGYRRFSTAPIMVYSIIISDQALKDFSYDQLAEVVATYETHYLKMFLSSNATTSYQLYPPGSEGTLENDQLEKITAMRTQLKRTPFKRKFDLKVSKHSYEKAKSALAPFEFINVIRTEEYPSLMPTQERGDGYFIILDSAWIENISDLSYHFNLDYFRLKDQKPSEWFENFINRSSKQERIKELNSLHYDLLTRGVLFPLVAVPVSTYVKKKWTLDFNQYFVSIDYWRFNRSSENN